MNSIKSLVKRLILGLITILPERLVVQALPKGQRYFPSSVSHPPAPPTNSTRLFVGAANMAGQGWQWARAVERHCDDTGAVSMSAGAEEAFSFPVDQRVPKNVYRWSPRWKKEQEHSLMTGYSHVLVEFGRPLLGDPFGRSWLEDIRSFQLHGVQVGVVFHGSDIRLPSRHAATSEWSPFHGELGGTTALLEHRVRKTAADVESLNLPIFVSTPDLLIDVPRATWLPVVVEGGKWQTERAPFAQPGPPVVVHAPSKASLKGSDLIDEVLVRLERSGLLEYRRVHGVTSAEMPKIYREADIVVDQLGIGSYGVAACEAMAAGRVVVSQVSDQVRAHVSTMTGLDLPIVEVNRDTLEATLRAVVAQPETYRTWAKRGPQFIDKVHDGTLSAAQLGAFLSS